MTEKNEAYELKDEDLDKVTGGGSGTIPEGGIVFETYSTLEPEYYYSHGQDLNEVVYVYAIGTQLYYTSERFVEDIATNSWRSINKTSGRSIDNVAGFMIRYKFRLNVQIG